ncbi:DnaJ-like protein subfamily C member 13 [Auxenochlorella protothecoides]|uniref:DnaJ-like protein subfamily C member 13 n=1 Tax=Auxenochlorella protothecoides TaxID=3075 RepID=A0A087SA91_AUXPR|nr:DnaJ-like protein subfamily C member 13 [Auxenochlorella protothecoides]KFM22645.1 DnaJ-like protein subfamily C member 13 [Auxenochlorella protothecoides]
MSAVDTLLQRLRGRATGPQPCADAGPRFLVTKQSWRGQYHRVLCITPAALITHYPETGDTTNVWSLAGDADIVGLEVGPDSPEGGLFTLRMAPRKGKDVKLACRARTALLTVLYQSLATLQVPIPPALLSPPTLYPTWKLRRGVWVPATLRISSWCVERLDPATGSVRWRLEYANAATPAALLERRAGDYELAGWRPLARLAAAVRYADDPQWLGLEWGDGAPACAYVTPARDALLAAIVDVASRAAGRPIPVLARPTAPGDALVAARGQAARVPALRPNAEVERIVLGQLTAGGSREGGCFWGQEAARQFAACGALSSSSATLALAGLSSQAGLTGRGVEAGGGGAGVGLKNSGPGAPGGGQGAQDPEAVIAAFQQRVRELNACVPASGVHAGSKADDAVVAALVAHLPRQQAAPVPLGLDEATLAIEALQCLDRLASNLVVGAQVVGAAGGASRLFACMLAGNAHLAYEAGEEVAAARAAKAVVFISDSRCDALVAPLAAGEAASPLLVLGLVEAVAAVVCEPGSRSTEQATLTAMLQAGATCPPHPLAHRSQSLASLGRPLFCLFGHAAPRVAEAAALTQRAVAEGGAGAAAPMRAAALSDGALLHHMLGALGPARASRTRLSRELVALWCDEYAPALGLLRRAFPPGLAAAARPEVQPPQPTSTTPPEYPSPPSRRALASQLKQRPGTLRGNWEAFWLNVDRDHAHAGLIWNAATRTELREALQAEVSVLKLGKARAGNRGISWNHEEFRARLPSLQRQLSIGGVYVRLLLDGADSGAVEKLAAPRDFFLAAYHHFLCLGDADRIVCVRAMAAAYAVHAGAVGPFDGVEHVARAADATASKALRAACLAFLATLVAPAAGVGEDGTGAARQAATANADALLRAGGVGLLVDALVAGHEDGGGGGGVAALHGNLIASTSATQPLRLWRVHLPDGPESTLGALSALRPALDAAGERVVPAPAALRALGSGETLPHLAQALLTNDPALVSGACTLMLRTLCHDEAALGQLYRTGAFFFALAYCGSNQLEAAHLLKLAHLAQHSKGVGFGGPVQSLAQRSFLGGLIPDSLIYCLEERGPEAFAAALVEDNDTPELIWTHAMRLQRLVPQARGKAMDQRMLRHLGDFPARLREHGHSLYEYTPCPPVGYPEIEGELWCHRYYLRHLVDEVRFPDWQITDAVPFLQSLLDAWRVELARQPLSMTESDACAVLQVQPDGTGHVPEDSLKAAYRRLARAFHPDKNPDGRDRFEAAQCLVFRRCTAELAPYKYAGYALLLRALTPPDPGADASEAQQLLGGEALPLVRAAAELAWLTCAASGPNAEELCRSGGLEALGALFERCVAVTHADASPVRPEAVWSAEMRAELETALEGMRAGEGGGDAFDPGGAPDDPGASLGPQVAAAAGHTYAALDRQLLVAGVFVRVYVAAPGSRVSDPAALCRGLVTHLARADLGQMAEDALLCLRALRQLLEGAARLLGVLSTRAAVEPLLRCLAFGVDAGVEGEGHARGSPGREHRRALRPAAALAEAALGVLATLASHAGCVDALASDRATQLALWAAAAPPTPACRDTALRVLGALASAPVAAWAAATRGGALFLLSIVLDGGAEAGKRRSAAALLAAFSTQPTHGARVRLLLGRLLPQAILASLLGDPAEQALATLESSCETPACIWNPAMLASARSEVGHLVRAARRAQALTGTLDWAPEEGYAVGYPGLEDEVFIGGVYVRLYLKDPQYPLRCVRRWGAVDKLARALDARTPALGARPDLFAFDPVRGADAVSGAILRLLHRLVAGTAGAEALARTPVPALPLLLSALGGGVEGQVLALETLLRALSPSSRSRDSLVGAALARDLPQTLLARLGEAPQPADQDAQVARVVIIDVLHALARPGQHEATVAAVLDASATLHTLQRRRVQNELKTLRRVPAILCRH